ncbi:MAG: epimerase [Chloroflexi bacterium HGW-Chloroflexi-3]|nr:MAG: epimerase [Chloroflexi bacterium HGW-Chloroflexi-3]
MKKERVVLLGASGTMGFAAFQELWKKRDKYEIVLLLLPANREKLLFRPYEIHSNIKSIPGRGRGQGNGLEIIWGDATQYGDVLAVLENADWVLNAMAYISPMADYYPNNAKAVNVDAIKNVIKAIQAQPGGREHIRYIHTGTVAETGDRQPPIHWGRVGDPLNPSVFDYYAVTKITGERAVLESNLRYWVSIRMSYIIPTDFRRYMQLQDPIMFHMPLNTCMENISSRDAGFGLVNALSIPKKSDFWRRVYNMGGGLDMRINANDYMDQTYKMLGISGKRAVTERNWYALRNFHLQYFLDSHICNEYLHYCRDSMQDVWAALHKSAPILIKILSVMCRNFPGIRKLVERRTHAMLKNLVENHANGTRYWYLHQKNQRVSAFFNDFATYEAIPDWSNEEIENAVESVEKILEHGYDESKAVLTLEDIQRAADFRGGECLSDTWDGDMFTTLTWRCAFNHDFTGKPNTILKAGHWCPVCVSPPWKGDQQARRNPFFAQVWNASHDPEEDNVYSMESFDDIAAADKVFMNRNH